MGKPLGKRDADAYQSDGFVVDDEGADSQKPKKAKRDSSSVQKEVSKAATGKSVAGMQVDEEDNEYWEVIQRRRSTSVDIREFRSWIGFDADRGCDGIDKQYAPGPSLSVQKADGDQHQRVLPERWEDAAREKGWVS